ncbi:3-oxoacid CoA-transferase subunit B [Pseudogracilibacillus auburnensis]|uniref:3-oxoacid CoA-transferase/3-oxoacid CoA-transferase subunit B n=1 Tax=Pseudogracilibacillus auburnensis TaxID=1494959 RepID=A0A2V3W1D0_9BACI|nr:3-oxoacid CoA-transferase subunit B [Pseudogracilibacillus auburnensis]MBO1002769.1 3-oxoacid CoA-transferase subunit B [Pseudogracilibacillus auburnensis]PXW87882.1 3-oxoacid CoA-transferase/3-oxoacid CoA-transferase subunit B [Pseudogracilibacillus auburnensis]
MDEKQLIAARAAQELKNGNVVNLGIGIPTKVVDYLPPDVTIHLHSENGILGLGPSPTEEEIDPDLVNAGKLPVTIVEGSSFFDSPSSFAMIRGKHVDVAVLGVLQVDQYGRIANWAIPGKNILGVGGAMDLLEGAKKVIVTMLHTTRSGESKIVESLSYPITSQRRVDMIITELAVFKVDKEGLLLMEMADGCTIEDVKKHTLAPFRLSSQLTSNVR